MLTTVSSHRVYAHNTLQVRRGVWGLGDGLCDAWVASDVMCCTASILNLAAISVDRSDSAVHLCTVCPKLHLVRFVVDLLYTMLCKPQQIESLQRIHNKSNWWSLDL